MGDVVAWRVVELPASGQISNVSKLVIRWPAGMPEDRRVPDPFDKLVEYARLQLEREHEKVEHAKLKLQRKALKLRRKAETTRGAYGPQDKGHRTYAGYRAAMIGYEKAVREVVGATGQVSHEAISVDAGGPTPRTQRRTMEKYGLRYHLDWPPSTWPETPPGVRDGQLPNLS